MCHRVTWPPAAQEFCTAAQVVTCSNMVSAMGWQIGAVIPIIFPSRFTGWWLSHPSSHSQHAITQTTGIEETRLASESSREEKNSDQLIELKRNFVRQDMVSTHESNPKHAIGRERHDNFPALYVA